MPSLTFEWTDAENTALIKSLSQVAGAPIENPPTPTDWLIICLQNAVKQCVSQVRKEELATLGVHGASCDEATFNKIKTALQGGE